MAGEIEPIRKITRNVKLLALQRAERILAHPEDYDSKLYNETYLTVLKNAVPRTQEVTGEDGNPVRLVFDQAFNAQPSPQTEGDSKEQSQVQGS